MKKVFFHGLMFLLFVILVACSGGNETSTSNGSTQGEKSETEEGVIKLGLSVPMSGAAANWGITSEWLAKQAAEMLNEQGGVTADGKNYKFEVIAYDNKYDAGTGTQVAQTLINKDKVDFVVATIGSAPTQSLQALSEPAKILHFTSGWSRELKGTDFPYTFTTLNTPVEVVNPLFTYILEQDPNLKNVAMINPDDATGTDTAEYAEETWNDKSIDIVFNEFYQRGTSEFSLIATKIASKKPDIVDLGATPPGDAGLILKALSEQGWDGVKIIAAGTSGEQLIEAAGEAANDVYLGLAPNFSGEYATEIQKDLAERAKQEINETLNAISIQSWDAIMALKAAIEKTETLDSEKLRAALPTVEVDSSYGPAVFGSEDYYGTPQQLLLPVTVTHIQNGTVEEVNRVNPEQK